MIIGFTATRQGITAFQREHVRKLLEFHEPAHVVHGGAIGGDDACDLEAASSGILRIIYPSNIKSQSQWPSEFKKRGVCIFHEPHEPLKRNKFIIDSCNLLIACPAQPYEVLRSGTWMTVRHAAKINLPTVLIYPA